MKTTSSLARLQQLTCAMLMIISLTWLGWHWSGSPILAVSGGLLILLSYSAFLALEFLMLRIFGGADPAPRPGCSQLLRAWLGEIVAAPQVFCWRQPFRWRAIADEVHASSPVSTTPGVVFIHGFVCNRGFWNPWLRRLQGSGQSFVAVNLEPVFGSIEDYVPIIEAAVQRVAGASGRPPVLVGHSMGGLAARAWFHKMSGAGRVQRIITIASPHKGTWLGQFSRLKNGSEMRVSSAWLRQLERDAGDRPHTEFTCWYSNCDNIVFPVSNATLSGADNRLVQGVAHVALGFHPRVMEESLRIIQGGDETQARVTVCSPPTAPKH